MFWTDFNSFSTNSSVTIYSSFSISIFLYSPSFTSGFTATSIFIKTDVIRKVGGYDEDIPLIEDLPFWVKVAKHGYKIDYSEIITVNYRLHNKSVTKTKNDKEELSSKYAKNLLAYSKKYKQNNVSYIHYFCYNLKLYLIIFLNKFGLSKNIFLRVRFIKNCINQIINI